MSKYILFFSLALILSSCTVTAKVGVRPKYKVTIEENDDDDDEDDDDDDDDDDHKKKKHHCIDDDDADDE